MHKQAPLYGRGFDWGMAAPLAFYLIVIVFLLGAMFGNPALLYAITLSMVTSVVSTLLSVLVAMPAGYVLSRHRFPGHFLVDTILDLPIVVPPLVMGLAILIFFNTEVGRFLDRGLTEEAIFVYKPLGIVVVQFVIGCAFAVRTIKAGFDGLDPRYEQMAMTLGAGRIRAFLRVVLPNVAPSLVAGTVISWARIFGLFGPVILVAGTMRYQTEIMPTTVFLETSTGRLEVALVIGACMVAIATATLVVFKRLGGKGYLW